ncbi:MAG: B12-binding domain-containing radical SAM protein [Deltaproteobacteria bacterium]
MHDHVFYKYVDELTCSRRINNRILLVNPPLFELNNLDMDVMRNRGSYVYPPTGLLFLAAALQQHDIEVQICDLNFEILKKARDINRYEADSWQTILEPRLQKFQPAFVGISCMFSHFKDVYQTIIRYIFDKNDYIVVAGGTQVSFEYQEVLNRKLAHFAVIRDGEEKLPFLLNSFLYDDREQELRGEIYFEYQDVLCCTRDEERQPDIDYNLSTSYDLIPIAEYHQVGSLNQFSRIYGEDVPFSALSVNRGCRGHCAFCSVRALLGKTIRSRSIENVVAEIEYLRDHKGIRHFDILDDDFLADNKKCKSLLREIIRRDLKIKWYVNNGVIAGSIDEELLQLMLDSGCLGFKIGIESGNPQMLKKMRKPATLPILLAKSELFAQYPDIYVAGNYIIGFPQETFAQMLDTFIFANKMKLDWSGFYICQPIKGADVFDSFEELGDERCEDKPQNYMPSRDLESKIKQNISVLLEGPNVFSINGEDPVSEEQLKEVWFVFGFITNFINNKNLKPEGRIDKFIDWVKVALKAYPSDAGMMLFLYLANVIRGNLAAARDYFGQCQDVVAESPYWENRFSQFELGGAQKEFIGDKDQIRALLQTIISDINNRYGLSI